MTNYDSSGICFDPMVIFGEDYVDRLFVPQRNRATYVDIFKLIFIDKEASWRLMHVNNEERKSNSIC